MRSRLVRASRAVLQASFHEEGSEDLLPPHAMPAAVRVCGKLAVLDNVLSKVLAAKHKVSHQHHHFSVPYPYSNSARELASADALRYIAEHHSSQGSPY